MMTIKEPSLTDQILALLQNGAMMNVTQIATKIKHDPAKTRQLLYNLHGADRIIRAGMLDGETSYRLAGPASPSTNTAKADARAAQSLDDLAHEQMRTPPPDALLDLPSVAPSANPKAARAAGAKRPAATPALIAHDDVRVGLLATGELFILAGSQPLIASAATTDALRRLLMA